MITSNYILNCKSCGSQTRFEVNRRWTLNDDHVSARCIIFNQAEPSFCPLCSSSDVVVSDEEIDQWLHAAMSADFKISSQTLALVEQLYEEWLSKNRGEIFVDYLKEFKAQVNSSKQVS